MKRNPERNGHPPRKEDPQGSAETAAAQALGWIEPSGGVVPSVQLSTTYHRGSYSGGRVYGRIDHAAFEQVEALLCKLEDGPGALVFASGMAAAAAVFQSLDPGSHVIAPRHMYFEMRAWLEQRGPRAGLTCDLLDEMTPARVEAALRPGATRLIWVETPGNPFWQITDISAIASLAHAAGARLAVDSTAASPVLTRPLALGADLVVHSATKYLNGHGDVIAGAVVTAQRDTAWEAIRASRQANGAVPGGFECWLLLRGMRTLFLRVRAACANAQRVAEFLQTHRAVSEVLYPGLATHPGHEIAKRQMQGGFGGMLSFRVAAGGTAALAVSAATRRFVRATSLGGVESLIEHRASVEGGASDVPADLLRVSVGIERADDLISDLNQALESLA